jgi:hypothetical protein
MSGFSRTVTVHAEGGHYVRQKHDHRPSGGETPAHPHRVARQAVYLYGSLTIHQDFATWVQVIRGAGQLNGLARRCGDGAAVSDESVIEWNAMTDSEILFFDVP